MNEQLRQATLAAVGRGLDFLESAVAADGGWPSWRYDDTGLAGERALDHPPFTAAVGVLALDACRHPRAKTLLPRTREFITRSMEYPGIWRYPGVPPSVDDTAVCALAVGPHPWLRMGRLWGGNTGAMLAHRDACDRFVLWMPGEDWPPGLENEVDAVVNANVLAYLGDHPETRAAERWVESVVLDRREVETSPYYIEPVDLHFAMARATCFRDRLWSDLRPTLAGRLLDRLHAVDEPGDSMRVAQSLSALDMLGFDLGEAARSAALVTLLDAQRSDGSWPPCLAWKEPPGWGEYLAAKEPRRTRSPRGFASEALTTAFCIEAIDRVTAVN